MTRPTTSSEATRQAIIETLAALGLDASDPIASQQEFVALRQVVKLMADPEFRKDLEAVRAWREAQEAVKKAGIIALTGAAITAVVGFMSWAIRSAIVDWIAHHGPKPGG